MKKAFLRTEVTYRQILERPCRNLFTNTDNLLLVVRTTSFTNPMGCHKSAALAAPYQSGSTHLPVCSPLIPSTLRRFILRTNRHYHTSLFYPDGYCLKLIQDILSSSLVCIENILYDCHTWVGHESIASAIPYIQILSAHRTYSFTILSAQNLCRPVYQNFIVYESLYIQLITIHEPQVIRFLIFHPRFGY